MDKSDSGQLSREDIIAPEGWVLLSFIMDPRTGLGRFRNFRISNYQLMEELIDYCRTLSIDEVLQLPDVQERIKAYFEQEDFFKEMLKKYSRLDGDIIITDLRGVDRIYSGNRFLLYSLFPDQNISIWIIDGKNKQNCVFALGQSVINRSSRVDIGSLMLKYGGGGHKKVGTCQVPYEEADRVLEELINAIKKESTIK